jgi:nucleotide-binding universal stress UspA family protein
MFGKLLVPIDGSSESAVALAPATALAAALGAAVRLVRVAPSGDDAAFRAAVGDLAAVERELGAAGLAATSVVREGDPAAEIVAEAGAADADLVIMATHGRSGLARALLGSVADGVLTHSPVPVVLLRPGGHRMTGVHRLVVPLDGSPGGTLALGVALGLTRSTGARLILVEVAVPLVSYMATGGFESIPYLDPGWDEEERAHARGYVDRMAERLRRAGVGAEARVVDAAVGTPSLGIARALAEAATAADADLVVMSTHALTGPARTLLGSVADAVVHGADRAVLLIRPGMRLPREAAHGTTAPPAAPAPP